MLNIKYWMLDVDLLRVVVTVVCITTVVHYAPMISCVFSAIFTVFKKIYASRGRHNDATPRNPGSTRAPAAPDFKHT